jgi:hypothetical protein
MITKHKAVMFVLTASIATAVASAIVYSEGKLKQAGGIGFPFKVLKEEKVKCLKANAWDWEVNILFERQYYSIENLERLFRFYSDKYEHPEEHLYVSVYTDTRRYEDRKERQKGISRLVVNWDAYFQRERDDFYTTDYNSWYTYAADLDNRDETRRVVVKGIDPFDPNVALAYVRTPIPKRAFDAIGSPTGFAFDELFVELPGKDTYNTRRVRVVLPKEQYNKDNLERLFRFYSHEYANREEALEVGVYTDIDNLKRELLISRMPGSASVFWPPPSSGTPSSSGRRSLYYDAWYYRTGDSLLSGGSNEFYDFSPDLDRPERTRRVVLRGKRFGATR